MMNVLPPRARRAALWVAAIALSAAVFALYLQPDFVVTLANQLWACF
jgi:type II secretory pathway component PulM